MNEQMKTRPILFSGEMVRAILDGGKTQTRRTRSWGLPLWNSNHWTLPTTPKHDSFMSALDGTDGEVFCRDMAVAYCPYGKPGERLWVRETWTDEVAEENILYRADGEIDYGKGGRGKWSPRWKPSIFMPRKHARIFLEIVNVRVERLQEISEQEAKAEGVEPEFANEEYMQAHGGALTGAQYRYGFHKLWGEINGKRAPWSSNPWVWVVEFKRL